MVTWWQEVAVWLCNRLLSIAEALNMCGVVEYYTEAPAATVV
jgi:hypothetical protein